MSILRMLYLGLAIWGAVHPFYHFAQWFAANGIDLPAMVEVWRANPAVNGLVWDLAIAAVALTLFVVAEVAVRRNWSALWAIPATWAIGVGCGLPLYLFLRSRPVE